MMSAGILLRDQADDESAVPGGWPQSPASEELVAATTGPIQRSTASTTSPSCLSWLSSVQDLGESKSVVSGT